MLTAEFQSHKLLPILVVHWTGGGGGDDSMIDCLIMCATSNGKS